jgi:hypothetical protein
MKEATHYAREAHLVQTQLIEADEGEGKTKMTLVMVHAQDHLMTSILAKELVTELIDIYRTARNRHNDNQERLWPLFTEGCMHHLGLDIGGTKMEAVLLAARGLSLASTAPYTEGEL